MEDDAVEISSDDGLVEMSVAASPEPSSVSVFTHRSRLLLLRSVVLAISLDHDQSTPQKTNLKISKQQTSFSVHESV